MSTFSGGLGATFFIEISLWLLMVVTPVHYQLFQESLKDRCLDQGSVLGPLLFICYINEVTLVTSSGSEINLFTDDIVLFRIIRSSADFHHLQQDINSVFSCISESIYNSTKLSVGRCSYQKREYTP